MSSLIIETLRTKIKGIIAVTEVKGDIKGILWITAVTKKYILGNLANWIRNDLGRKVITLYLVVEM